MGARRFDAIVIGSGAGGATAALWLCQHGLSVLIVERGKPLALPGGHGGRSAYIDDMRRHSPHGFAGGLTKFYGAALYRMKPQDFRETEQEAGISPGWPIGYADLAPYYDMAERLYRVHGDAHPHPPLPHHPVLERMRRRMERAGVACAAIPRGVDYGPGRPCTLCADCDAHVCARNAKMDAETAALRPALATGRAQLWTRSECLRIETTPDGRQATGAWIRRAGDIERVAAGAVLLCAGVEGTPLLLRRSASARARHGLGNEGGALGRHLAGHSAGMVFPLVSATPLPPIHSKTLELSVSPLGTLQAAGQLPLWRKVGKPLMPVAWLIARHGLTFFYMTEALPSRRSGFLFDGDRIAGRSEPAHCLDAFARMRELALDSFRRAGYPALARRRRPYVWHEVGTARMGDDPAASVINAEGQVHGVAGLYAADASSLPSAGTVNTALTIMALALRTADHIAGGLKSGDHRAQTRVAGHSLHN